MNTRKPFVTLLSTIAVAALAAMSLPASAAGIAPSTAPVIATEDGAMADQKAPANGVYVVQMVDQPVVAYTGGVKGLKATAPRAGQKIDPDSAAVVAYVDYLTKRQDAAVAKVGGTKLYSYVYAFNGFAAALTDDQVTALRAMPGVLAVTEGRDSTRWTRPPRQTFLGLDAPGGLWDKLGGADAAGEGVIIGLVDSGIWPESLSFSDRTGANGNATKDGKLDYQQIPGGTASACRARSSTRRCATRSSSARSTSTRRGAATPASTPFARGSSTRFATTTATARTPRPPPAAITRCRRAGRARSTGRSTGSRRAPGSPCTRRSGRSQDGSQASGFTSDLVEAIDQAVADGVDVINYSISGTRTNFLDPVQLLVPVRGRRRRVRRGVRGQQRTRPWRRWRIRGPGSPRSPPAPTTGRSTGPSRWATAPPTTGHRSPTRSVRPR